MGNHRRAGDAGRAIQSATAACRSGIGLTA